MMTVKERTTIAAISELRTKTRDILEHLRSHRVILERHQKPVAVMLNYEAFARFERLLDEAEDLILGRTAMERDRSARKKDFVDLESW